ncbi:MAG: DUF2071 domain-containing protein [Bacteroidia bacterium]
MSFLKNHPFAVETFFRNSLVLTYALPEEDVADLIPECLLADTFEDKWAFLAIALVDTKKLRPKGFPEWMGNDFILMGVRIFVRYRNKEGKSLRGLYILKSVTNKRKMSFFGNQFTHYNYTTADIAFSKKGNSISVFSSSSNLDIEVEQGGADIKLPSGSPFADWKEARRFAGPLPFTFTYEPEKKKVLIIEGVRQHWVPEPVRVIRSHSGILNEDRFRNAILANAFLVSDIPYYWKKGKTEVWKG